MAVIGISAIAIVYDVAQGVALGVSLLERGLAAVICILLAYWLSALVSALAPTTVSKSGIRSYTILGVYHWIEWSQVSRVEAVSFCGIRYAKIHSKSGGAPIWLPAFLQKQDRFLAQLRQHTAYSEAVEAAFRGSTQGNQSGMLMPAR
ncbi:MAG: hypothetical protein EA353_09620 [Puniceicoccaceae bacterium]|nr:MAG: hypothetical protein EA353_09620 [Puniceicoccaceae bacterium]